MTETLEKLFEKETGWYWENGYKHKDKPGHLLAKWDYDDNRIRWLEQRVRDLQAKLTSARSCLSAVDSGLKKKFEMEAQKEA